MNERQRRAIAKARASKDLWQRIVEALKVAGVPEPLHTAMVLKCIMEAAANLNSKEMEQRLEGLPTAQRRREMTKLERELLEKACAAAGIALINDSTMSMRFRRANLARFRNYLIRVMRVDFRTALRAAPPQGLVLVAVDVHVKETTGKPPKKGTRVPLHTRRAHLVKTTSDNKRYPYGVGFVVGVATWNFAGQVMCMPVLFMPMLAGQSMRPVDQARIIDTHLRPIKASVAGILLDRGYDDASLRNFLASLGWTVAHRVKVHAKAARWFIPGGQTEAADIRDLAKQLLGGKGRLERIQDRETEAVDETWIFDGKIHGHMPADTGPLQEGLLRLRVVARKNKQGQLEVDFQASSFVFARGPGDLAKVAGLYRARWRVETMLEQLLKGKPGPRAKTIHAEVLQFLTLLYALILGYVMRLILILHSDNGKFLGERLERYSAQTLYRFVLGLTRRLPI